MNVITIGGDQLTGKSTLCKDLVNYLTNAHATYAATKSIKPMPVTFVSAGVVFRAEAAKRGISVGELSKLAITDTDIDVAIEYETCKAIMGGIHAIGTETPEHTIIVEGRNPAVMARYCREVLDKEHITAVYLSCSPRIQARRFVGREIERPLAFRINALLPDVPYPDLHSVGEALLRIDPQDIAHHPAALAAVQNDPQSLAIELEKMKRAAEASAAQHHAEHSRNHHAPCLTDVVHKFTLNAARDEDDRKRYLQVYDFPVDLDYRNKQLYDVVVDTSDHRPDETLTAVLAGLPNYFTKFNYE